jgi:diguanylate cyclase (GGDEF)-like protein
MPELIDHLAQLTGFRDRDVLDVTLAAALRDLLHPRSVAIYRVVGEGEHRRWLTRARLGKEDAVATADSAWVDLDTLPALAQHPARCQALAGQTVIERHGDIGFAVFPLATDREVPAVLELTIDGPLADEAQRLVCSVLRIYRNFVGLLDYSERDMLTGLLNRKTFDQSFLKISSALPACAVAGQAGRRSGPGCRWWLGMIDIDNFKAVNDGFGHLIGDEVLLLLSRLMRSSFRFHDLLYRFGGEEFVVLMRCDTDEAARSAFERLRRNTLAYPFPQVGVISVSVGFTEVKPGDSPSAAIERADQAVYYAKAHGRNQVQSHAELVARGEVEVFEKVGDVELF